MSYPPNGLAEPHMAAPFFSRLVACGLLGRAEAFAALLSAAAPAHISPCGRCARLTERRGAQGPAAPSDRTRAAAVARHTLQPLLSAHAPSRTLLEIAKRASGPALSAAEVRALTIDAIARHLRSRRSAPTTPRSSS